MARLMKRYDIQKVTRYLLTCSYVTENGGGGSDVSEFKRLDEAEAAMAALNATHEAANSEYLLSLAKGKQAAKERHDDIVASWNGVPPTRTNLNAFEASGGTYDVQGHQLAPGVAAEFGNYDRDGHPLPVAKI